MGFRISPVWKQAPFLRLVIPLLAGILWQWYMAIPSVFLWRMLAVCGTGILVYQSIIPSFQFRWQWLNGLCIHALLFGLGALLILYKNSSSVAEQTKQFCSEGAEITAFLSEPLSEKKASWKSVAQITQISSSNYQMEGGGKLIVYFSKSIIGQMDGKLLSYGTRIRFKKPLQRIQQIGSGRFDYPQYCAFAGIHFQVFLKPGELIILPGKDENRLRKMLLSIQNWVNNTLKKYIPGKTEQGLAEALLIGYKNDLDKTILQSYSNTGVVHVIAISGLHLGLIYSLLAYLCSPLKRKKTGKWLAAFIILTGLWLFSLLAGGSPSVLRSAVMFSFIVMGDTFSRNTSIYNTLSASAFALLCFHPFWLWDTGFQLSYAALAGIVVFMKPVYHWFIFKNRLIDMAWKLNAVTLSAQALTLPVSLYYFQQFPLLFMITNFIAVPLSSIILMAELLLCAVSPLPAAATAVGWMISGMIWIMNGCVVYVDGLPFSSWKNIPVTLIQVILMYLIMYVVWYTWVTKNQKR